MKDLMLGIDRLNLDSLSKVWEIFTEDQLDNARSFVNGVMKLKRYDDPRNQNYALESEWIARFLLFFLTMPHPDQGAVAHCYHVWQDYVLQDGCQGTRKAIKKELSQ